MLRFIQVIKKEFIHLRRDPMALRLVIVAPIIQLIMFGYAATHDVRNVPVAVFDGDRSAESRQLIEEIEHSYYFHLIQTADDPRDIERRLQSGEAMIGVQIPRDFQRKIMRGTPAQIGLYVDGTDSNTSGVATAYMLGILRQGAASMQIRQARTEGRLRMAPPSVSVEPRVWYNIDLSSINFMVPGVFGLILLVLTVMLGGLSIVRERETGTLEQLLVTPLKIWELLLGKLVPFALVATLDASVIFLLALGWFHVVFRGSLTLLVAMALVFLVNNLGFGLLISTLSRTQQQAQLTAFLFIMPSVLLSGFFFPIANMPVPMQYVTYLIPLRYFLEIVRGIFLKGAGIGVLWPQMLALTAFAIAHFAAGIAAFRKRL